jgi:hypothetical protein
MLRVLASVLHGADFPKAVSDVQFDYSMDAICEDMAARTPLTHSQCSVHDSPDTDTEPAQTKQTKLWLPCLRY